MQRSLRRRLVPLTVAVLLVVWLGVVGWLLADAAHAMDQGRVGLDRVRAGASPTSLLDPVTQRDLTTANERFARARRRLRNPLVAPLRVLPVVGRQIRAGDRIVATAGGATHTASDAVDELHELAGRSLQAGPERVATLNDLADLVARANVAVGRLDPGSAKGLIGPLADAIEELQAQRVESREGLTRAHDTTRAVAQMLDGPMPYLLLGANNGEMRAGSGMFLSAASLGFDHGSLVLGDVHPTDQLVLPAGSVRVTGDLAANWPWLDPGRDLRNLALTADFPQSATVARQIWPKVPGGGPVGGVIVVDVDALRSLLRVVGPVEVGGVRYTVDTVRGELLHRQYDRFEGDRNARRDRLSDVAQAVFVKVEAGDWKLDGMVDALLEAVRGRHLLVWSADPGTQEALASARVDGHLTADSVSAAMLNRAAQKLDSYLETTATVTSKRRSDGRVEMSLNYRVVNNAPAQGEQYLLGPNIAGLVAGEHRGIVVVNLPAGVSDIELTGATQILQGTDGPTAVVAGEVVLKRGESVQVVVKAVLPRSLTKVSIEPSARIPRTRWVVNGKGFAVDRRRTVSLDD